MIGQWNAWLRRALDLELWSKIEEKINTNKGVEANIEAIEGYIKETHPASLMRQEVYALAYHSSDISFTDIIQ